MTMWLSSSNPSQWDVLRSFVPQSIGVAHYLAWKIDQQDLSKMDL